MHPEKKPDPKGALLTMDYKRRLVIILQYLHLYSVVLGYGKKDSLT